MAGAALAGAVTAAVGLVGGELEVVVTVFAAQDKVQPGGGERRPEAVAPEIAGDIARHHGLIGSPTGGQGQRSGN